MSENLFEAQYDVTKKTRLVKFYQSYKILIFSFVFIIIITLGSFSFYIENKENKKILLSENYLDAKIYLNNGDKDRATKILKEMVFENSKIYSTLSLFLILNQNLITDYEELNILFEHLLSSNKFSKEERNLLIYKKALFNSSLVDESALIESLKPILNKESFWQAHALLLLGDYFMSKGESIKAIEFYQKIFTISNLHHDIYNHARFQLALISNE